ncbi:MAG: hypothetical protein U0X87_00045 [Anaerolineales bacterium]
MIWFIGYIAIYFMRLPAYQHGRYIIPALPILYFWGMVGFIEFVGNAKSNARIVFMWKSLVAALSIAFCVVGAWRNAQDVAWVETEMVETAKWVRQNLPPDSLLAVHDIGAIGYFTENPLLDLAGLVNPEVIPFIRDEGQAGGIPRCELRRLFDHASRFLPKPHVGERTGLRQRRAG